MSAPATTASAALRPRAPDLRSIQTADAHLGWLAVAACGLGCCGLLFGGLALSLPVLLIGAGLLAVGATLVLAGAWVSPLHVLAIVLPLPPLYASDALRLSPALTVNVAVLAAWVIRTAIVSADETGTRELRERHRSHEAHPVPIGPVLLLLGAVVLAAAFAERRVAALGDLVNWALALALLFVAVAQLRHSSSLRHGLAATVAVVAALSGMLAVLQAMGLLPSTFPVRGSTFQRATLGFGWPNELGMFLGLALPFSIYAIGNARSGAARALALGGALLVGCGLLATFSRGSWVAVILAPTVLLVVGERRVALRVWTLALLLGVGADVASGGAVSARIAATLGDWVVEQRAALTLAGLMMFAAKPILGIGPGGFADGLETWGPRIGWLWDYLPTAQNAYVQMAAETGIVGLGALLLLLFVLFRRLLRSARRAPSRDRSLRTAALWSFTTALLLAFNEWIFTHGVVQLFVIAVALGLAEASGNAAGEEAR